MSDKICPILQAGRMMGGISTISYSSVRGEVNLQAHMTYDQTSFCLKEECEWFEHGCPAHPVTEEVINEEDMAGNTE